MNRCSQAIVQAGAPESGRQLAAEMILASGGKLADAQRYYYADVGQRAGKPGAWSGGR